MSILATLTGPVVVLVAMLVIYKLALSSRARLTPFSLARARMRTRSTTGSNAMLMLTGINVAALMYELSRQATHLTLPAGAVATMLTILALTALLLLIVVRSLGDWLIAVIGVAATLIGGYLQGGLDAVFAVLTLSVLALFLLGAARGFIRPRP